MLFISLKIKRSEINWKNKQRVKKVVSGYASREPIQTSPRALFAYNPQSISI